MNEKIKINILSSCYDYLTEVKNVLTEINKNFDTESIWDIRQKISPNRYIKKDNIELIFHGIGVRITENNQEIMDIETGIGIEVCGIELWRLYDFIKHKKLYNLFLPTDEKLMSYLKEELSTLLKVGKLKKISGLYFINDEKNRPKLKKYKHNNK